LAACWCASVAQALTRAQPHDIWRFLLLAAPVACLAKATIATAALGLVGAVPVPTLATQRARKAPRGE
jgi:integral membrane sensor domain MASE1